MSAAMKPRLGPLVLVALQGWACGETRLLDTLAEGQTRLRLTPSEFIGSVPCQQGATGALQSYVVELQEVTLGAAADAGVTTAFKSGAVPCSQSVLFPTLAGRFYGASVRGFDHVPTEAEIANLAGRWTASCGRGSADVPDGGLDPYRPTISQRGLTVPMRGCTSFDGSLGDGASQLVVDQTGALGDLTCGQGAGDVVSFEALLGGVTLRAACGQPLVFEVSGPERYHTVQLTGFGLDADAAAPPVADATPAPTLTPSLPALPVDAGDPLDASLPSTPAPSAADASSNPPSPPRAGVPRWRTECVGRSLPGIRSLAYCDPLQLLP